jgi:ribosomal protein S27AE
VSTLTAFNALLGGMSRSGKGAASPAAGAVDCPRCGASVARPLSAGLGEARVTCGACANSFLSEDSNRPAVTDSPISGLAGDGRN